MAQIAKKRNGYRFSVGKQVGNKHLYVLGAYWLGITNRSERNIMAICEMDSC